MPNDLSKVKIGDKFITKSGRKVIEIRSKTRGGFKILVMITGKEISVTEDYIKNEVEPHVEDPVEDPVEASIEEDYNEPVKSVDLDKIQESANEYQSEVLKDSGKKPTKPKKKKRGRKPGTKNSKKPKTNKGEKKMAKEKKTRKETKKALILEMLKQGPQTRESLANAIIEKGLSKHNDETKEKSYASVILHTLKKDGAAVCVERGKYVLAGQEEAPAEATTEE